MNAFTKLNFFKNLRIGTKIITLALLLLTLAIIIAGVGIYYLNGLNTRLDQAVDIGAEKIKLAARINRNLVEIGRAEKNLILAERDAEMDLYATPIAEYASELETRMSELEQLTDDEARLSEFQDDYQTYLDYNQQIRDLARNDQLNQAADLSQGEARQAYDEAAAIIKDIVEDEEADLKRDKRLSDENFKQAVYVQIGVVIASILLGIFLGMLVSRQMSTGVRTMVTAAKGISQGDLNHNVMVESKDEIGELGRAFQEMIAYLEEMTNGADSIAGGDFRVEFNPRSEKDTLGNAMATMRENLRELTRQIQEVTTEISSMTQEMLAATSQQASGAKQQASGINETSTTVQEMKQTAEQAANQAKMVSEAADDSIEMTEKGLVAAEDTVAGMDDIKSQVSSIAETILGLSEQTQQIGEIISSVNDIADQSKLLALNAAIEAARAGEAGKGFTVVAGEVRSLAEQSAGATARVREILSEIQTAANTAVMVTEEGTKRADVGSEQIKRVREAIMAISANVKQTSQQAQQIAASAAQQKVGTDQINLAMENIEEATLQSESGTEQVQKAAQNLNAVAEQLDSLVNQYQL